MPLTTRIWEFFIDIAESILIAALVCLVIYLFLFRPFIVSGHSMDPNFNDGEHVMTNLIMMHYDNPRFGDVIVFKAPLDHERDYIKRVIGTPGDRVKVENGMVWVNGKQIDESAYLPANVRTSGGAYLHDGMELPVPADSYFVMGDNRNNSSDSRAWGFVGRSAILGRSMFVYWPPTQIRLITNPF